MYVAKEIAAGELSLMGTHKRESDSTVVIN